MKVKLTKNLNGKYSGSIGDIIEIDPKDLDSIIRQGAGTVIKEQPKEPPKEDKKEKENPAP